MTEQITDPAVAEAIAIIDEHLGHLNAREMVKASEVSNLLLDLRLVLTPTAQPVGA